MKRTNEKNQPKVLIFDDDPMFGKVIKQYASRSNIALTVCQNMEDFALEALKKEFDVAVIDYDLESFKGTDVTRALEGQPVLMISGSSREEALNGDWPESVKGFVHKRAGFRSILNMALKIVQ